MDLSLGDVLLAGANGTGGNFGTMTPQEEAVAVTPGSVLDAVANRGVQLAATPGNTFQGTPTSQPGQMSDEDMARQLFNESSTNKNAFDAATLMVGAGGAGAGEDAVGAGAQPGHVLGITRDKLANAEDAVNEAFDRVNIPGEDWLYDKLEAGRSLPGEERLYDKLEASRFPYVDQLADYFSLGSGSKKLAAPAIVGNAPLFDYSRLGDVPSVPQFNLPRATPARGTGKEYQDVANNADVLARTSDAAQSGLAAGVPWYNTMPLKDAYIGELGSDKGVKAYNDYIDAVAATSPNTPVPQNVRNASYFNYLRQNDMPLPELVKSPNSNHMTVPRGAIPAPYGNTAQTNYVTNMRSLIDDGALPVMRNPKPSSFAENLKGNYTPVTIDRHNMRSYDLKGELPGANYGFLEGVEQNQANQLGITPAQYQASLWFGDAGRTGVKSGTEPFLQVLEDRINKTADARGLTPAEVLRNFIRGNAPLLSGAGVAGGAALDSQLTSVPDSR